MSIVKLDFNTFSKKFHNECGRKYPEMVTFQDYLDFYARTEAAVAQSAVTAVTVTQEVCKTPAINTTEIPVVVTQTVTQEVVTEAKHDAPSKYQVDFAKTAQMTEKELMTAMYVLNQQLVKKRIMRSNAVKHKLTDEQLAGIFSAVMTKALKGDEVKTRSILAKHVPEEAVKGIAARELSGKQRKAILSQLSQHEGVTLMLRELGKSGTNAEFKGTISSVITGLARCMRLMNKTVRLEKLEGRMSKVEEQLAILMAGRTVTPVTPKTVTEKKATVYSDADVQLVLELKKQGHSVRHIEEVTGINRGKVHRIIKAAA